MTTDDPTPPHGLPMGWPSPVPGGRHNGRRHAEPSPSRDDTTRYLCAAAHLDDDFADGAVREYLVEHTRPVPDSPGVDAATVLAEAVAARTRRKLRDAGLIVLMVGFVVLAPVELILGWVAVAAVVSVPVAIAAARNRPSQASVGAFVAVGFVTLLVALFGEQLLDMLTGAFDSSPSYYYAYPEESTSDGMLIGAVAVAAGMLSVLVADRFAVWRHLHERFWPNRLSRLVPWSQDRLVLRYSPQSQLDQLDRYVHPQETSAPSPAGGTNGSPVPVVVYRGFVPFVGAGVPVEPWSIAVPLESLPDAEPTRELTTSALYHAIREEVTSLRKATVLTPGRRLGSLELGEVVIVAADELVDHIAEPVSADFLQDPREAPYSMLRRERAEAIRADPLEWARYYQCYRVETWDRDLVVTVFVHVAVGTGALYVEWTPCVLRPVRKKYQEIDVMPRSPWRPAWRAVVDLLTLPVSLPSRLRSLFTVLRPLPQEGGMLVPARYGSAASLRELAADGDVHNYFQRADVDRYLKMMESRLVLAVSRTMRAAGYSPASFDEQAAAVVNNNVQIAGSVTGDVVVGSNNRVARPQNK